MEKKTSGKKENGKLDKKSKKGNPLFKVWVKLATPNLQNICEIGGGRI